MVNYNNPHINFSHNNQTAKAVTKVLVLAIILAFIVIILGAYTRLTNAGLGCPDWPGCYGQMIVKNNLDTKAWTEMIHRYLAGSLGLIILITSLFILFKNPSKKILSKVLVFLLLSTVIFQVLLGMWTVTYKLMPTVVMGHLLGGFCTISLLLLLLLNNLSFRNQIKFNNVTKFIAFLSLLAVCGQIILGGWTSANYAAIPCLDFPACNGQYFPTAGTLDAMNPVLFNKSYYLFNNFEGGVLDYNMRVTIQLFHRWGALIFSCLLLITIGILKTYKNAEVNSKYYSNFANWLLLLLIIQISLGIINVKYALPLITAVGHNAIACLLLLSLITLNYKIHSKKII